MTAFASSPAFSTIKTAATCAPELEALLKRWGNWQRAENIGRRTIHDRAMLIRRWAGRGVDPR